MAIGCLDVHYPARGARAACVVIASWPAGEALELRSVDLPEVDPYQPGQFYRRELPALVRVLAEVRSPLQAVVVDGHVILDARGRPGLGAHLFEALGRRVPVVGVAKRRFGEAGASPAIEVLRGESRRPLFVTAAGLDARRAAEEVARMHGSSRLPWALSRVDALARGYIGLAPNQCADRPHRTGDR
jgi:deoxyribonuclease V